MLLLNNLQSLLGGRTFSVWASSLAYTLALSFVPFLMLSFSVFHLLGGSTIAIGKVGPLLIHYLALGANDKELELLFQTTLTLKGKEIGLWGFLVLTFFSVRLVREIDVTIHRIWFSNPPALSVFRMVIYFLLVTVVIPGSAIVTGKVLFFILSGGEVDFIVAFSLIFLCVAVFFRTFPPGKVRWKTSLSVGFLVTTVWYLTGYCYEWLNASLIKVSFLYGAFAFVPVLLAWFYVLFFIFLLGAAVVHHVENRHLTSRSDIAN